MIVTELIEIAAVDDQSPFLQRLRQAVSQASDMTMLAVGSTARDAYRIAAEDAPDVLLLDLDVPGGGIKAARTISRTCTHVKIIMVSGHRDDEHITSALASGAIGYLLKDANSTVLQDAIRAVHAGRPYITEELASRLVVRMFGTQTRCKIAARSINSAALRDHQ